MGLHYTLDQVPDFLGPDRFFDVGALCLAQEFLALAAHRIAGQKAGARQKCGLMLLDGLKHATPVDIGHVQITQHSIIPLIAELFEDVARRGDDISIKSTARQDLRVEIGNIRFVINDKNASIELLRLLRRLSWSFGRGAFASPALWRCLGW